MTMNVGTVDRAARLILGALLIILTFTGTIGLWGWLGLVMVVTAYLKFCPLYKVLGVKTCSES